MKTLTFNVEGLTDEQIEAFSKIFELFRQQMKKEEEAEIAEEDVLEATFGGWADTIDCEELKRRIYESRLQGTRPEVKL
jgi:hypothetical protein